VSLSLKAIMDPFVRIDLVGWNPLAARTPLSLMAWFQILQNFGESGGDIDEDDEDLDLIPKIVEKVVIPRAIGKFLPQFFRPKPAD